MVSGPFRDGMVTWVLLVALHALRIGYSRGPSGLRCAGQDQRRTCTHDPRARAQAHPSPPEHRFGPLSPPLPGEGSLLSLPYFFTLNVHVFLLGSKGFSELSLNCILKRPKMALRRRE